ncbi:MAG: tetratricopeptide repeat protein [Gemmataceae bacterium]|nr:tetratricopeptide repeat protein [Gemmataceae bacterium]
MPLPDWQRFHLDDGVLREPSPDRQRIIVWLPRRAENGVRCWERVCNVPGAAIAGDGVVCSTAATTIQAQERGGGIFGKLLQSFRKAPDAITWVLPTGGTTEQVGARQTDALLAWSEPGEGPLSDEQLAARWPQATRRQRLGSNLFLVTGVTATQSAEAPAETPSTSVATSASLGATPQGAMAQGAMAQGALLAQPNPRQQAEQLLAAARQAGDREREAAALADLGVACQRTGDSRAALPHLEAALQAAQEVNDQTLISDIQGNLGLVLAALGDPARGLQFLQEGLATARDSDNHFQVKSALDNLGQAYGAMRNHAGALIAFDEALTLASNLGDRPHEAEMLWCLAIQHAELGQRDYALTRGQEAIHAFEQLRSPHVPMLTEHLQKYAAGDGDARLPPSGVAAAANPATPTSGPGLLRMAFTAVKSMAKFVGSGLKTVAPAVREERLQTCGACEHHTGVRCKLCGCFTAVKSWLPHEHCPIGRWGE